MATEVERTAVLCPKCGEEYGTWAGVGLEALGPDSCPRCGFAPADDPRSYRDGLAEPNDDDDPRG